MPPHTRQSFAHHAAGLSNSVDDDLAFMRQRYPQADLSYFNKDLVRSIQQTYGAGARQKLTQNLDWRMRNRADQIPAGRPRISDTIMFWHGADTEQRPLLYLRPGALDMLIYDPVKVCLSVCVDARPKVLHA